MPWPLRKRVPDRLENDFNLDLSYRTGYWLRPLARKSVSPAFSAEASAAACGTALRFCIVYVRNAAALRQETPALALEPLLQRLAIMPADLTTTASSTAAQGESQQLCTRLLALAQASDFTAVTLFQEQRDRLQPCLGSATEALAQALLNHDFPAAVVLLNTCCLPNAPITPQRQDGGQIAETELANGDRP